MSFENFGNYNRAPGIQDGKDIERGVLGCLQLAYGERMPEYLPFSEAVSFAKEHQPRGIRACPIIKNAQAEIAKLVSNKYSDVRFYTAVGSPLDTKHGVDCFFEQGDRLVTVDLSMREKSSFKADVLLVVGQNADGEPVVDDSELKHFVEEVSAYLNGTHANQIHTKKFA